MGKKDNDEVTMEQQLAEELLNELVEETCRIIREEGNSESWIGDLVGEVVGDISYDDTLGLMVLSEVAEFPIRGSSTTCAWEVLRLAVTEIVWQRAEKKMA